MITWALHCVGIQHQIHYLNDFLFMGDHNTEEVATWLSGCWSTWESRWLFTKRRDHHMHTASPSRVYSQMLLSYDYWLEHLADFIAVLELQEVMYKEGEGITAQAPIA